ncbi:hypothetical protein [Sinorhizobium fredii]|uniref:hypothetical protein n=1 Tax=Rhizobium fredii TaxID=380 RepID=UPI0012981420|nr:hypothetical protein [Sinorhizobium fredii]MQW94057.1 hypothetical protein [Sinorhizobium fredii]
MVSSLRFVHEARKCVGTPYRHQGRLIGVGLDCVGVILHTMQASGCDLMGFEDYPYGPVPTGHFKRTLDQYLDCVWDKETASQPFFPYLKNGDILAMAWKTRPMHCGIAAVGEHGWNVIHSHADSEKVVEHRLDDVWAARVTQLYRIREVK